MANVLEAERQVAVIAALVNGVGVRGAERLTGVSRPAIIRLGLLVGQGCERLHNRLVRDLSCAYVDMDEQHSWVGVKARNIDPTKHDESTLGEQWTWAAIDRTSTLVIAWHVGKRDAASADKLVADTRARLATMPQISTDGLALYEAPILLWFGYSVPYAQQIKRFAGGGSGKAGTAADKFSPAHGVDFIEKRAIYGCPDLDKTTTYAIERSNLTNRQWNARLGRRTLAFSKSLDGHRAAVSLAFTYRALCHVESGRRVTAAMAAGIESHVWSVEELVQTALREPMGARPEVKPLVIPKPATTARELPGGRGWLQVVPSGAHKPSAPKAPEPSPVAPAAPSPVVAAIPPCDDVTAQLDLLSWKPRPRVPVQLDLFDKGPGKL